MDNITYLSQLKKFSSLDRLRAKVHEFYNKRVDVFGTHGLTTGIKQQNPILLLSNDYLAISQHPSLKSAIANAVLQDGAGLMMSAALLNQESMQAEFEGNMAAFMDAQETMLCQSGWCANTGLLQTIAEKDMPVYLDFYAHMSLIEGARAAGAKIVFFRHNDMDNLSEKIKKYGSGIIAIDAIYSSFGSIALIHDLVKIAEEQQCILVVDELHSLGVIGQRGESLVASLGLNDRVHFRTASLSKAFCGRAGIIACRDPFAYFLKYNSRPATFSSAVTSFEIAGLKATIPLVETATDLREQLALNTEYLHRSLDDLGYHVKLGPDHYL